MLASQALRSFLMGLELWKYIVIQFRSKAGFLTTHFFENCIQQFAGTVRLFYAAVSVPAVFPKAVFQSRGERLFISQKKRSRGQYLLKRSTAAMPRSGRMPSGEEAAAFSGSYSPKISGCAIDAIASIPSTIRGPPRSMMSALTA